MPENRRLTVQQLGMTPRKSRIRLKGAWLQEAGFLPGDRVSVHVENRRLVVEWEEGGIGGHDHRGEHTYEQSVQPWAIPK